MDRVSQVELDRVFGRLHGTADEVQQVLELLAAGPGLTAAKLLQAFPPARADFIILTIVWLAKLGLLDWLDSPPEPTSVAQKPGA